MKVVVCTRNSDKFREIEAILDELPIEICSLLDHPSISPIREDGFTLIDNALKKARITLEATGMWCISDDTGLFVDALEGAPGVRSARYAGEYATYKQNRMKLLSDLGNLPHDKRKAKFVCYAVLALDSNNIEIFRGAVEGYITEREIGTGGFGYDSVFMLPDIKRTFAQLQPDEKNRISHRAIAMQKLRDRLESILRQF